MKKLAVAFLLTTATAGTLTYAALAEHHGPRGGMISLEADLDGDGNITKAEIEAKRASNFATADTSGDGVLSFEEFEADALAKKAEREANRREHMFARLDSDGDGFVSETEMAEVRDRRMDKRFDRMDANNDGMISAEEREVIAEKMQKRGGKHKRGHSDGGEQ